MVISDGETAWDAFEYLRSLIPSLASASKLPLVHIPSSSRLIYQSLTLPLPTSISSSSSSMMTADEVLRCEACTWCHQLYATSSLLKCSGCRYTQYCSRDCQKKHWSATKSIVSPISSNGHRHVCKLIDYELNRWRTLTERVYTHTLVALRHQGIIENSNGEIRVATEETIIENMIWCLNAKDSTLIDDQHPFAGRLLLILGEMYSNIGQHGNANDAYKRARQCNDYWVKSYATLLLAIRYKYQGDATEARTLIDSLRPHIRTITPTTSSPMFFSNESPLVTSAWLHIMYMYHFERATMSFVDIDKETTHQLLDNWDINGHQLLMGMFMDRFLISQSMRQTTDKTIDIHQACLSTLELYHRKTVLPTEFIVERCLTMTEWYISALQALLSSSTPPTASTIDIIKYSGSYYEMLVRACHIIDGMEISDQLRAQFTLKIVMMVTQYCRVLYHDDIMSYNIMYTLLTRYGTVLSRSLDHGCALEWRVRFTQAFDLMIHLHLERTNAKTVIIDGASHDEQLFLATISRCIRGGMIKNFSLLMAALLELSRLYMNNGKITESVHYMSRAESAVIEGFRNGMPLQKQWDTTIAELKKKHLQLAPTVASTSAGGPSSSTIVIDGDQCSICGRQGSQSDYDSKPIATTSIAPSTPPILYPCYHCRWTYTCDGSCQQLHLTKHCPSLQPCIIAWKNKKPVLRSPFATTTSPVSNLPIAASEPSMRKLPKIATLIPPFLTRRQVPADELD
jgi:hypothetical protein